MQEIMEFFGSLFGDAQKISVAISALAASLVAYRGIYRLVGIFFTRKFPPARKPHKYAVLIAARNEEAVIGNLLSSIKKQDYPRDKLTVFVVADNCTDKTAQTAREHGAICYERFDDARCTKGYALQFLLERIGEDYGRLSFEGYFVFDADNLLSRDYVAKMNDAFDSGAKIITSYRNSKNFDENWIASTYALHWLRSVRHNHRARSVFRLATNIQGTGFLFSNEIVKDGWKYTSLTEDRALTADAVAQGYQITYQDAAVFYDEQPTSLKIALRQRLRWSKGHLQAFMESGGYLFLNIFLGKAYIKTRWGRAEEKERTIFGKILESLRHRFASFDTLMQLTPFAIVYPLKWLLVSVLLAACMRYSSGVDMRLFGGANDVALILRGIFGDVRLSSDTGLGAMGISMLCTVCARLIYRISVYFKNIVTAIYIFIIERRRIKKIPLWKKALFCFTWPTFDIIDKYTKLVAIFIKVSWKPIPHTSKIKIEDIS
ncbi:MAG: glycosyltransferase [Clostridia bacterium]|nr:glycosyltransferase [Clostridia bacterium]